MKSAGRPVRSIASRIQPGQYISPNDVPIGKKVYPQDGTAGQYIPEEVAQAAWLKQGGKRVEPQMLIRAGSPVNAIIKPNAVMNSAVANQFNQVSIGPNGSSMP